MWSRMRAAWVRITVMQRILRSMLTLRLKETQVIVSTCKEELRNAKPLRQRPSAEAQRSGSAQRLNASARQSGPAQAPRLKIVRNLC